MAELPHPSPAPRPGPTQFPPLRLQVDRRSLHVQRLDAQAAVDVARQQSILARHALLSGPAGADATPARIAADDASTLLQAAVDLLTALNGGDSTVGVTLDIDVTSDDATTVVRPHGELDLFTSSTLEQRCLAHLDSGTVDRLVVDLSAVTFLDSSAMAVLVEIHRVCLLKATPFAIIRPTARTRRLLSITRLDTVLDVG